MQYNYVSNNIAVISDRNSNITDFINNYIRNENIQINTIEVVNSNYLITDDVEIYDFISDGKVSYLKNKIDVYEKDEIGDSLHTRDKIILSNELESLMLNINNLMNEFEIEEKYRTGMIKDSFYSYIFYLIKSFITNHKLLIITNPTKNMTRKMIIGLIKVLNNRYKNYSKKYVIFTNDIGLCKYLHCKIINICVNQFNYIQNLEKTNNVLMIDFNMFEINKINNLKYIVNGKIFMNDKISVISVCNTHINICKMFLDKIMNFGYYNTRMFDSNYFIGKNKNQILSDFNNRDAYDIILLDNPTKYLDVFEIEQLKNVIYYYKGCLIYTTNNINLMEYSNRTLEIFEINK